MSQKVTPAQIIELVKSLPDSEHHIFFDEGKHVITNEWITDPIGGRAFEADTLEEAAQELIDYLYENIGHKSWVGHDVTMSGFPDLVRVKAYCTPKPKEEELEEA